MKNGKPYKTLVRGVDNFLCLFIYKTPVVRTMPSDSDR